MSEIYIIEYQEGYNDWQIMNCFTKYEYAEEHLINDGYEKHYVDGFAFYEMYDEEYNRYEAMISKKSVLR